MVPKGLEKLELLAWVKVGEYTLEELESLVNRYGLDRSILRRARLVQERVRKLAERSSLAKSEMSTLRKTPSDEANENLPQMIDKG